MKKLTLVRHAKSSWDYPELSDFERPLNDRGRRDAPVMGERALLRFGKPDALVSSPALRAITTAQVFAGVLGVDPHNIVIKPRIYDASADTLMDILRELDESDTHVMLFGHNPGLSRLSHQLARCSFNELPTCAIAHFGLDIKVWTDISPRCGRLIDWSYPKEK